MPHGARGRCASDHRSTSTVIPNRKPAAVYKAAADKVKDRIGQAAKQFMSGTATGIVMMAARGGRVDPVMAEADAFGNALGTYAAEQALMSVGTQSDGASSTPFDGAIAGAGAASVRATQILDAEDAEGYLLTLLSAGSPTNSNPASSGEDEDGGPVGLLAQAGGRRGGRGPRAAGLAPENVEELIPAVRVGVARQRQADAGQPYPGEMRPSGYRYTEADALKEEARALNIELQNGAGNLPFVGPVNPATGLPVGMLPLRLTPEQQGLLDAAIQADAARRGGEAVRPGDTGSYGGVAAQRRAFGQTEPLHLDHQPSYAAQVAAAEEALGRELTKAEASALWDATPVVASPRQVHQQTSPTYGGRNSPERISGDRANLSGAQARDRDVFEKAMRGRR